MAEVMSMAGRRSTGGHMMTAAGPWPKLTTLKVTEKNYKKTT